MARKVESLLTTSFSDQMRLPNWKSLSEDAKDYVDSLLVLDPLKRLTVTTAAQHKWITQAAVFPERWCEINCFHEHFCCKCDGEDIVSFYSDKGVTVKCGKVSIKGVQICGMGAMANLPCFIGSRLDVEKAHAEGPWERMCAVVPDNHFLNLGVTYQHTVVYIESMESKPRWAKRDTEINDGETLYYGYRCEMQTDADHTPKLEIGALEADWCIGEISSTLLQCVQLVVPEHMDNCVLGPKVLAKIGQGFLNFRSNWPKLASIVAIIRNNNQHPVKRINFPGASDTLYAGDVILLPRKIDNRAGPVTNQAPGLARGRLLDHCLDLGAVTKMFNLDHFRGLCNNDLAGRPPRDGEDGTLPEMRRLHRLKSSVTLTASSSQSSAMSQLSEPCTPEPHPQKLLDTPQKESASIQVKQSNFEGATQGVDKEIASQDGPP